MPIKQRIVDILIQNLLVRSRNNATNGNILHKEINVFVAYKTWCCIRKSRCFTLKRYLHIMKKRNAALFSDYLQLF